MRQNHTSITKNVPIQNNDELHEMFPATNPGRKHFSDQHPNNRINNLGFVLIQDLKTFPV
jgi:hypothetical protein